MHVLGLWVACTQRPESMFFSGSLAPRDLKVLAQVGVFKGVALLRLIRDAQMTRCRMQVRRSVVRDAHMVG